MDSGSSNFKIDEQDPELVLGRGLGRAKGVLIDAGLHSMYVHSIRRAKHFIYIENQFFTGMVTNTDAVLPSRYQVCQNKSAWQAQTCMQCILPWLACVSIVIIIVLLYICSTGWQAVFAST